MSTVHVAMRRDQHATFESLSVKCAHLYSTSFRTKALAVVDFGSNTVNSDPSKVVVVMKNSGKVSSSFRFNTVYFEVTFSIPLASH